MATTGFWPIKGSLKAAIDYADNPDKTTAQEFVDSDLYAALRYAGNDSKTDRKMYVTGISCGKFTAYEEMIAVKRHFGERGLNVAYHGYQSFDVREVTPELAHRIGVETAKRMWGENYQVLVTTHLNTDNLHNHFVVNSVSFRDGSKFKNKIGDHLELRKISDEVCMEHGLSVLQDADFYKHGKKEYWLHRDGKQTHRDMLKADIDRCLQYAHKWKDVVEQLQAMGYEYDPQRDTIKAPSWERGIRLGRLGYSDDSINACTARNRENDPYFVEWRDHRVYRPDTFPLASLERQLEFKIEHSYNTATVLVDVLFYMLVLLCKLVRENDSLMLFSPELRAEAKDIRDYLADYHFLRDNGIHTMIQLENSITLTEHRISELEAERQKISNRIRRPKSPEEQTENKERRKAVSKEIEPLRKHLNHAKRIREKSPHLYELLKLEHELENRELRRNYERNYGR